MAIVSNLRVWNSSIVVSDVELSPVDLVAPENSMLFLPSGKIYIKSGPSNTDWTLTVNPSGGPVITNVVEYITLDSTDVLNKQILLSNTPTSGTIVQLDIISGGPQEYGFDYTVVGNTLTWDGFDLMGVLGVGDKLRISYFTP